MFSHQDLGYSDVSAGEALASALGAAMTESSGAADMHILVTGIVKVGKGWKATVNVTAVPKAGMEESPDIKPKKEKSRGPVFIADDDEDEKKAKEKEEHKRHLEEEYALGQERQKQRRKVAEDQEHEFVHLYMDMVLENLFQEIAPRFEFTSVHFLSGPLWEEANRHTPDIDFYEAIHANSNPMIEEPEPKPKPEPKRSLVKDYQLAEDLEDE